MLTEEHIKEDLSRAYVQAVSAMAGVSVSINGRGHDYGIDGSFHEIALFNGRRIESGFTLDFQLKATTRIEIKEDLVHYPLDAHTVNLLALRTKYLFATPAILIVLHLPSSSALWLQLSEEELILKNCCYWALISSLTPNLYSATIKIPRSQLFSPSALNHLMYTPCHG